ncbi:amidohydrolase family protein [Sphingomonas sp. A2-49]|uniref:amidohydrolase family protein n=1 Tax=Sphingomonas sp. A2-49 TaxID=1391375 RepID=UPI0021CE2CC4|nr:amidohydrolase family protein [Sphingomonas sp. A2-49]MCU6454517.1 amidohydrolase family protein [Sphingomonas sp. A2-49]
MTTRPPFVDAHLHLWDRGRLRYPWLAAAGQAPIAASYGVADYRREAAAWNVVGAVHVDAGAHPDDGERETEWLEEVADADGLPIAIVARVALDDPDVAAKLAFHAGHRRVRGIRHLVNWDRDPARCAYPRDLTRDAAWRRGYALLAGHGLSFDFHGFPPQLSGIAEVAARHPDVPLIVDHLGLPRRGDWLEEWRTGLIALAALPHVAIKLSGAGFVAAPFDPAAFGPLVREVIDRFGTGRVMVATNFPTDRLSASMDATLGAYEALLAGCSDDERRDLWGRNADRIYRLGLDV